MLTQDERRALRALAAGSASEGQQKLALDCIIERLAGYYGLSAQSSDPLETYFMDGRRYVGGAIVGVLNTPEKPATTEGEVTNA